MDAHEIMKALFPTRNGSKTMTERRLKIRIGTALNTGLQVVDAQTGELIEGVSDVAMDAPVGGIPTVHLTLNAWQVDWEGNAKQVAEGKKE